MLLFHGFHVCGQLHRQKCRRFPPTGDNIQHGLTLYPESKQYGIGRRFEFGRNERSGRGNDSHDGLVSHLPFRSEYPFQLFPVGTPDGFPAVTPVDGRFFRVPAGNTLGACVAGRVVALLQADRDITVAALFPIGRIVSAASVGFVDKNDREVGIFGAFCQFVILFDQRGVYR